VARWLFRIAVCAFALLVVLFFTWTTLLGMFEGGVSFAGPRQPSSDGVVLPWWLRGLVGEEFVQNGVDTDGGAWTVASYSLPELFEDTQVWCVIDRATGASRIWFIEARGADSVLAGYPSVTWQ